MSAPPFVHNKYHAFIVQLSSSCSILSHVESVVSLTSYIFLRFVWQLHYFFSSINKILEEREIFLFAGFIFEIFVKINSAKKLLLAKTSYVIVACFLAEISTQFIVYNRSSIFHFYKYESLNGINRMIIKLSCFICFQHATIFVCSNIKIVI